MYRVRKIMSMKPGLDIKVMDGIIKFLKMQT